MLKQNRLSLGSVDFVLNKLQLKTISAVCSCIKKGIKRILRLEDTTTSHDKRHNQLLIYKSLNYRFNLRLFNCSHMINVYNYIIKVAATHLIYLHNKIC